MPRAKKKAAAAAAATAPAQSSPAPSAPRTIPPQLQHLYEASQRALAEDAGLRVRGAAGGHNGAAHTDSDNDDDDAGSRARASAGAGGDQESSHIDMRIPPWAGILLRVLLALFWPAWVKECVHLHTHGISPYDGGVCHQAPLLIGLFEYVPSILTPFVFILADVAISRLLVHIAEYKRQLQIKESWPAPVVLPETEPVSEGLIGENDFGVGQVDVDEDLRLLKRHQVIKSTPWTDPNIRQETISKDDPTRPVDLLINPKDISTMYLLNPFSIIICIAQSTQLFSSLAVVAAIYFSTRGRVGKAGLAIAAGAYLSIYPLLLLPPCILMIASACRKPVLWAASRTLLVVAGALGALLLSSLVMIGDWSFINATYGTIFFVTDLTPNVGLFWYFFIEMFDQFRTFFLVVFHITAVVFVVPLTMRFSTSPLMAAFLLSGVIALFKSYPSIADTAVMLTMSTLFPEVFKYAKYTFVALNSLAYASVLGPLFFNLWVYSGAGNANFFYAITLVFALAQVVYLVDVAFAYLRREWERTHPGWRRMRLEVVQI
ncbi:hypothetical protein HK105_207132 [Polyrhizophydium stewartii]|uniref:Uncharacterized protein n=1 Tax=Polyrhizophydium stewartii TaxID=2732419 RepID=A0ABR4N1H3_9FUNG